LIDTSRSQVRDQTGITEEPSTVRVVRAQQAIAQYNVGHSEARDRARELLGESAKWLSFAGAAFDGVGVNDCVMHGRRAADSYIANEFVAGRL
jgi:oxygen-dependent protoporphyrinogen oxidase